MRKKNKILWVGIFVVIVLFAMESQRGIFNFFTDVSADTKYRIFSAYTKIKDTIAVHFSQAKEIVRLREVELQKQENDIIISFLRSNLEETYALLDINAKPSFPNILLVEAYSYVNMGQYTQVWLKSDAINARDTDRIYGLIRNGFAVGIATMKDGRLLGILNGDSKVSYVVYIGESRSVGVLKNDMSGNVVIEYINAWSDIKEGDEVITSGLDSIFFEGVKVGRIKKVRQEYSYVVAEVELYESNQDIGYFWLVDVEGDFFRED